MVLCTAYGSGISLIGSIAAGQPVGAIENQEEELAISPALLGCKRCFGLRVRDMPPGATFKVVRHTRGTISLESANPAYRPLVFEGPQRKQVIVLGKYMGIVRKA